MNKEYIINLVSQALTIIHDTYEVNLISARNDIAEKLIKKLEDRLLVTMPSEEGKNMFIMTDAEYDRFIEIADPEHDVMFLSDLKCKTADEVLV